MRAEDIARVCHEVNRAYCLAIGDNSQVAWDSAPEWQRKSCIAGVVFHQMKPDATVSESHESWLKHKVDDGWVWGPIKDEANKRHPCVREFHQLPVEQQAKDYIFRALVHALSSHDLESEMPQQKPPGPPDPPASAFERKIFA